MDQKKPERLFGGERELDMLRWQLDLETVAIGSPGVYTINYAFISQVFLLFKVFHEKDKC